MFRPKCILTFSFLLLNLLLTAQKPVSPSRYLQKKGRELKLSDTTDFSDLKKLDRFLREKRIVLLGESTHGAREINLVKNRLIHYLHQELGFRVLLLESGMGEILGLDRERARLSPEELRHEGLTGPWRSEEYIPLMRYLKEHPDLLIAGFDVQRTGTSFTGILETIDHQIDGSVVSSLSELEANFWTIRGLLVDRSVENSASLQASVTEISNRFRLAKQEIETHRPVLRREDWPDHQVDLILRTLQNRIDFLRYYYQFKLDNNYVTRFAARDSVMADNIHWLLEQLFPNEKIIISAHNYHIARHNERDFVMGEKLVEVFGDQLFAIGIFPGSGSYANNNRQEEAMETTGNLNDLQHIIRQAGIAQLFLPIPSRSKPAADWLFRPITVNNTFISIWGDEQLTLADAFDGLIFLQGISPAVYR